MMGLATIVTLFRADTKTKAMKEKVRNSNERKN